MSLDVIYLQIKDREGDDITWCEDRINDGDVAYIRKTLADQANARAEVAESDALKMRLLLGRVYLALSRAAAEPTDTAELVEVMTLIEQIAGKGGAK